MPRRAFKYASLGAAAALSLAASRAGAQACCAGASAITPGRLALHEDALVGLQLRGAQLVGSFDPRGRYRPSASGSAETELRQDVFAAVRFLHRAQLAVLVPFVETRRSVAGQSDLGGGLGDINVGLRYDALLARALPGIALLAGVTLPTGVPVESADNPLATDATGIGAVQAHAGLALEQLAGAWTFSGTALIAQRLARDVQGLEERLGTQGTFILAAAYASESELALAASAAYAIEGNATIDNVEQRDTSRALFTATASAAYPLSDSVRVQGALFLTPPLSSLGANQSASAGLSFTVIYAWL